MENNDTDTLVTKYIAAFGEISFKGKKGTTEEALELAYTDMSRRARGHSKISSKIQRFPRYAIKKGEISDVFWSGDYNHSGRLIQLGPNIPERLE